MTIGERIKKIRVFRKMTMDDLGGALGFEGKNYVKSVYHIRNWCNVFPARYDFEARRCTALQLQSYL